MSIQKAQLTILIELRRELGIEPRDIVMIELENGRIRVETAKSRLHSAYQSIPALDPPRHWKEVEQAAFDEFAASNARVGLPGHDDE